MRQSEQCCSTYNITHLCLSLSEMIHLTAKHSSIESSPWDENTQLCQINSWFSSISLSSEVSRPCPRTSWEPAGYLRWTFSHQSWRWWAPAHWTYKVPPPLVLEWYYNDISYQLAGWCRQVTHLGMSCTSWDQKHKTIFN